MTGRRVLLVEDHPGVAEMIVERLLSLGFRVSWVEGAEEALDEDADVYDVFDD